MEGGAQVVKVRCCSRGAVTVAVKDIKPVRIGGKRGETIFPTVAVKCRRCCDDERRARDAAGRMVGA